MSKLRIYFQHLATDGHRDWLFVLPGLLLLGLFSTVASATPGSFDAKYIISLGGPIGERSLSLATDGEQYTLTATTQATSLLARLLAPHPVAEKSTGHVTATTVKPDTYLKIDDNKPTKNMDLHFDWQASMLTSKKKQYKISGGTLDLLSETLMWMVSPPGTKPQQMELAYSSRPKSYTVKQVGEETIETQAGTYKTTKYRRERTGKSDDFVYIWCAPALNNLPVKVENHKDGRVSSMVLNKYNN